MGVTRLLAVSSLALLLVLATLHLTTVRALADEAVKIRVEVTDEGFKPEEVEVEEGKLVELTFVWAHQGHVGDEHIMVLEGYKLESEKITSENRETTLKFVANKPGTFGFRCDLECEVHDITQNGRLKVGRGGTGASAAAALTPTKLTLSPSSWVSAGDSINLMAVVVDEKGAPVSKAEVHFALDAEFAGTKGQMAIGTAKTDVNGVAYLNYRPTLANRQQKITARFAGMGVYDKSEQAIEISQVGVPAPAYTTAPRGLDEIWNVAPRAFAAVILGIWASFGFALYQALSISFSSPRRR